MTASPAGDNKPTNMWEELNRPKDDQRAVEPEESREDEKAGVPLAGIVGGAVAIAAVAFAGFIVMGGGEGTSDADVSIVQDEQLALSDGEQDADDRTGDADTASAAEDSADETADETPEEATDAGSDDASADDDGESANNEADGDAFSPPVPAGAEGNYSILSRGKLYLRGEIPSPLIAIGAVDALEDIMGEGNVVDEYVINPDAPFEMGSASNVFIDDTVLFGFGSAEIAPDFYPLLGLGVVLLELQEGVTIEIYGHTDSAGSDEANLALSQARVDAVQAFWVSQGADPSRITAIGRGEAEPVADNSTPEGQQLNRRVEIVINGFVFSL